jgi:hypothetical protein
MAINCQPLTWKSEVRDLKLRGIIFDCRKGNVLVAGGPYRHRPSSFIGVKMAAEIDLPCDVDIPTIDFSIPDPEVMRKGLLRSLWYLLNYKCLYVGCMGGIGRTGLFMALMARLLLNCDGDTAIAHVRKQYNRSAVETDEQREYVSEFEFPWTLRLVAKLVRFIV